MRYRMSDIRLLPEEDTECLRERISDRISGGKVLVEDLRIIRESVDARHKDEIRRVYTVDFDCDKKGLEKNRKLKVSAAPEDPVEKYDRMTDELKREIRTDGDFLRPVVAGFGPCGLFAALLLSEAGLRPIVLERGSDVDTRMKKVASFWKNGILDTETNVQFGEGGAGTFSDGKLTTGTKDMRRYKVLKCFADAGADPAILYRQKPHIGTDVLRVVVKNLRKQIIENGGEVRFDSRLTDISAEDGRIKGVFVQKNGGDPYLIKTDTVILATGHSARDTVKMLYEKDVYMTQKQFSIGVRCEHSQRDINISQYGSDELSEYLGAADYKLSCRCGDRGVYTFCMCPGGEVVIASSEKDMVVTNGMSCSARDGNHANSAVLVDVKTSDFGSDHPLAGIEFQRKYERLAFENGGRCYRAPECTWGDLRCDTEDSRAVRESLPGFAVEGIKMAMPEFGRKIRGFDDDGTRFYAVESRSSSPVRIERNGSGCAGLIGGSELDGLYPAGEGAGYAGGIMSAAVDGLRTAERILKRYI